MCVGLDRFAAGAMVMAKPSTRARRRRGAGALKLWPNSTASKMRSRSICGVRHL